jgi:hypothetical protein
MQHNGFRVGGIGDWAFPMETATATQNPPVLVRSPNFFQQILPATGLALGVVLTTAWISFLGYEIARFVQAVL